MSRNFDPAKPEMMDRAREVTPEFERDMRNLVSINRRFGGHRLVQRYLEGWMNPGRVYRVLDLCTGVADVPRMMVDWARPREITLRIDAVDANAAVLSIARRECAEYPEIHLHQDDVLKYAPDNRYDLVHCSLSLHHFADEDVVKLLRNARSWSNRWVLIADLERSPLTTAAIWMVTGLLYRDAATVHDGRLSARRAFSFRELRHLAHLAGWQNFGHSRSLWCRQVLWLDEHTLGEVPLDPVGMPIPA
jgi:SAM-dependent methyltransferase